MSEEKQGCSCWLKGCAVVFILVAAAGIGGGIYLYHNAGRLARAGAAAGAEAIAEGAVKQVGLPAEQEKEVMLVVREQTQKIRRGEMKIEQVGLIIKKVAESPATMAIMGSAVETKYYRNSALTDEEKKSAHLQINRFCRAAAIKVPDLSSVPAEPQSSVPAEPRMKSAVPQQTQEKLRDIFMREKEPNKWELRQTVALDELRRAVEIMKKSSDDLAVASDYVAIDVAGELRKAIEKAEAELEDRTAGEADQPAPAAP